MSPAPRDKWNQLYSSNQSDQAVASRVLSDNLHLLPVSGTALELACGLGGNALLLAKQGLEVHAWDCSDVALSRLASQADSLDLVVYTELRDIVQLPPLPSSYDVIVVSHYLERDLVPDITNTLKPGGVLFYQTYTINRLDNRGPNNPDYLLGRNELLELFSSMAVLYYREDDRCGDLGSGYRNEAMLVAQKD